VSAASYTLITTTHKVALSDLKTTMYDTCKFLKDNVVKHRIMSAQLADPVTGVKAMRTIALREFANLIEEYQDLTTGYRLWSASPTARMIESEYKIEYFYEDNDSSGKQLTKVSFREIPEEYGSYIPWQLASDSILTNPSVLCVRIPRQFAKRIPKKPAPIKVLPEMVQMSHETLDLLERARKLIEMLEPAKA
jgi:hypothetical protein